MMRYVVNFNNEPCDIYIGRPSRWANPWQIGPDGSRSEVLELYEGYLQSHPKLISEIIRVLPGKRLGCHCYPMPCHGDLLARIANSHQLCMPLLTKD